MPVDFNISGQFGTIDWARAALATVADSFPLAIALLWCLWIRNSVSQLRRASTCRFPIDQVSDGTRCQWLMAG
jgi:hypothetical protein